MSQIAIIADGLSKQYQIGRRREKYRTLRDSLADTAAAPFRRMRRAFSRGPKSNGRPDNYDQFWAVKDLSFEIKRGEVVGVIGRNGAGKSTLLKILARITEPTNGYAEIRGRVGALLEVGTGFHPELTGRENIFLNGAILGMRRDEIERKFDEIVEFAEVSKFIETPVKRYSSGMHLRLAFSVAAHLEPEILLVDEVLAVGDVAFQKKCVGKMEDVASQGRTVIFVSHNLAAIKELCQTSIVINQGRLDYRGPVLQGLAHYGQLISDVESVDQTANRGTHWQFVRVNGQTGELASSIASGQEFFTEAQIDLCHDVAQGFFFCIINDAVGNVVLHQRIRLSQMGCDQLKAGNYLTRAFFPPLWLAPGVYTVYFKFLGYRPDGGQERHLSERVLLDVTAETEEISRSQLTPPLQWTIENRQD